MSADVKLPNGAPEDLVHLGDLGGTPRNVSDKGTVELNEGLGSKRKRRSNALPFVLRSW